MAGLYGACAPCRIRGSIIIVRAVIIRMVLGSRTESGGLAERLNAPVLKTGVPERAPEVRILHPPPRITFRKIKVGCLGALRLGMVFPRENPSIFEGERKRPLGNAEVRTDYCPSGRQRNFFDFLSDLRSDGVLSCISLRTRIFPFSTSQIVMTFLCFGGDKTTALSATEKSSKNVWFEFWRFRFALIRHHFLNGIKKFLCYNRFMLSVIQFAVVLDNSIVDFVLEHILII